MRPQVLIVDDDEMIVDFISNVLERRNYELSTASSAEEALVRLSQQEFDLVISDVKMAGMSGLDLLDETQRRSPETAVVVVTAYGTIEDAVRAIRGGAQEYLIKPVRAGVLETVVDKALEHRRMKLELRMLRDAVDRRFSHDQLIGNSLAMRKAFDLIDAVANSRATVLVTGESGTGKELVAKAIHHRGPRRAAPFIAVNCAALPESLFESELFGHERGSFTNAIRTKRGLFELAESGTILLDEISEMPSGLQAKLLRVLQEREIQRIGAETSIAVDVRVIATSNRHLPGEVERGSFREDLYFRLNVIPIELAPLRERCEDIPHLVEHFIQRYNVENGRSVAGVEPKAMTLLEKYTWPGNVRELENFIERAVVISSGDRLKVEDFPRELVTGGRHIDAGTLKAGMTVREMEKQLFLMTLDSVGGNQTKAADLLGVTTRTIRNKLHEWGVRGGKDQDVSIVNDGDGATATLDGVAQTETA